MDSGLRILALEYFTEIHLRPTVDMIQQAGVVERVCNQILIRMFQGVVRETIRECMWGNLFSNPTVSAMRSSYITDFL
jgi:hypothetical protein